MDSVRISHGDEDPVAVRDGCPFIVRCSGALCPGGAVRARRDEPFRTPAFCPNLNEAHYDKEPVSVRDCPRGCIRLGMYKTGCPGDAVYALQATDAEDFYIAKLMGVRFRVRARASASRRL